MKNAETSVVKVVLYGALSSLGSALMAETLRRQHEVIAILDDLNALAPLSGAAHQDWRPVRCETVQAKCGRQLCGHLLIGRSRLTVQQRTRGKTIVPGPVEQVLAVDALIDGMQAANIARLFLVGDFDVLDGPEIEDRLQLHAAEEIREALQSSTLHWTMVNAPHSVPGLTIEHFSHVSRQEPSLAEPLERLNRVAVGIADELRLNMHVREHVSFVATDAIQR